MVAIAAIAAIMVMVPWLLGEPSHRDLTVQNPTDFPVDVTVRSGPDDPLLGVGTVSQRGTRTFRSVIDQGDRWIFEFSYGGVTGAEVTVSGDQLDQPVTVPDTAADEFVAAGLAPQRQ